MLESLLLKCKHCGKRGGHRYEGIQELQTRKGKKRWKIFNCSNPKCDSSFTIEIK